MQWPPRLAPANTTALDVVVFGENSLDFVGIGPRPPEGADKTALDAFDLYVGGQAATAAVACARQGLRTRYVGSFGADDPGNTVRAALARDGVDVVAVERAGAKSRVAMVLVDSATGSRTVFGFRDPALAIDPTSLPPGALVSGRVLMLDATDLSIATSAARLAREAGVPTIIDVDQRRAAWTICWRRSTCDRRESLSCRRRPGSRIGEALQEARLPNTGRPRPSSRSATRGRSPSPARSADPDSGLPRAGRRHDRRGRRLPRRVRERLGPYGRDAGSRA